MAKKEERFVRIPSEMQGLVGLAKGLAESVKE